ncbi:head-tail connector protein [Sphingomonas sp. 3-13AW]|uniref:head-tail connector protein n=1 Tax=Sphingomonas sp. 3-13AW TaxID=3050450 RepID=UPI003BB65D13
MRVVVITPPVPVVTAEEARRHLRLDDDEQDMLIEGYIAAATAHIDGPDGWLGRAIGEQTLVAHGDLFREDPVRLPYPPVVSIEKAEYQDAQGAWQTLDGDAYELRGDQLGSSWGTRWPTTRAYRGAAETVRVTYRAGYATVPPPVRVAILMMVADMYRNPGEAGGAATAQKAAISTPVAKLLAPFRVYS